MNSKAFSAFFLIGVAVGFAFVLGVFILGMAVLLGDQGVCR